MSVVVAAKNVHVSYGDNKVIDDANFEIVFGDFVCVVGANGSGKSTLIKAILGLLKTNAGKIILDESVSRAIGYFPQESKIDRNFPATVWEIVRSGGLGRIGARIGYDAETEMRAKECLKLLKISKLRDKCFADLSGGQKQKVLLARALVATKELLILDEPSNNLDYKSRRDFYELLKKLNNEQGITIIMITHDLDAEDLIGNKVLAIKDGAVEMYETNKYLEMYK